MLAFAFLVSLLTGIIFGGAPAWLSSQARRLTPCAASTALPAISLPFLRRPSSSFKWPCRWCCFRELFSQDTQAATPVVLVNQSFARRFFPNQNPIGKHFSIVSPKNSAAFEVAGVFADFKMSDARGDAARSFCAR
jgi:hypothetical protein